MIKKYFDVVLFTLFFCCLGGCIALLVFRSYESSLWDVAVYIVLIYVAAERCFSFGASQANVIIDAWAKCQIKLLRLRDGDIVKVSFPPDMPAVSRQKMLDRLAEMVQRGCVGGHICVIDASSVDVVKSNEAGPV